MRTRQQATEDFDWDSYDYALDLEKEWRKSLPRFPDKELLQIFPEAKAVISEKITEWEEERDEFSDTIKKKLTVVKYNSAPENQWFWRAVIKAIDGVKLLEIEQHIERLKRLLMVVKGRKLKGRLTEEQIQQARAAPIENLISQPLRKCGKTLVGLCPLHNERHPSFYIYPETNSCWCYGCNQGGDAINFIKLLHGYQFKEAVQYLIGK